MIVKENRKRPITFWLTDEDLKIIDVAHAKENFRSRGEVVSHRLRVADIYLKCRDAMITNPEKLEQARLEVDELRKQEKFGIYFESATHEQRMAIIDMIKLIDEGQWKQTKLIGSEINGDVKI